MKKIRYGMIGFGGIAENRIAKEGFACNIKRFRPLKKAVLLGAFDRNPARRSAVEALGLKWYESMEGMLNDPDIDAVYIATNNASHIPLSMEALKAGKHVISEKPLAINSAEAAKAIKLAKEKKLSYTVDHMMVYNAWNRKAAQIVRKGQLGKINDCSFHMEFAFGYDPEEAASWRCSKIEEMGGPIGDVASHCFYVAEYIFGKKIKKLAAVYLPKIMTTKAEDGAYIKFFFEDGMQGSVKCAFSELRGGLGGTISNLGFEIYGDKAVLRSYGSMFQLSGHSEEPVKIRMELDKFDGKPKTVVPAAIHNIYQNLIEDHAASILSRKLLSGDDARHNLLLCEAAHRSARSGCIIIEIKE